MRAWRCKCGKSKGFGSDWPRDCEVCEDCGSTFASHPDHHPEPIPHDPKKMYNQNTGEPEYYCRRCFKRLKGVCEQCGGRGYVEVPRPSTLDGEPREPGQAPCPKCGGGRER